MIDAKLFLAALKFVMNIKLGKTQIDLQGVRVIVEPKTGQLTLVRTNRRSLSKITLKFTVYNNTEYACFTISEADLRRLAISLRAEESISIVKKSIVGIGHFEIGACCLLPDSHKYENWERVVVEDYQKNVDANYPPEQVLSASKAVSDFATFRAKSCFYKANIECAGENKPVKISAIPYRHDHVFIEAYTIIMPYLEEK